MPTMPGTFRSANAPSKQERKRERDKQRGSARQRGYTARWDRTSIRFREANPLCLGCQAVGVATLTAVTDHTTPHGGDQELFWDEANWQPSCTWHHDVVKAKLEHLFEIGKISADDLRLDSAKAIELTLNLRPEWRGQGGQKV